MQRSKFFQFFPPPQFLQMPAVGLDISDRSMRFVELIKKRNGFEFGRFGERMIPRGVIESGEVKKPADLRAVFIDLKKEFNLEHASISLPEEKAYTFELHLPVMHYKEIRGAIELILEEHVPIPVNEALFDFEIKKETETNFYLHVSVVPRVLVDKYLEAFSGSGISPVAFEIETDAIARSVVPSKDKDTCIVIDFGRTRTGILIISENMVQFTATIAVGGDTLTELIAKNMNIPYDDAEKLKREKGIEGVMDHDGASFSLVSSISVLRDEVNKHQDYWHTHVDEYGKERPRIQKIYLCGGDSNLSGFVEYISAGFSIPVVLANTLINVNSLESYIPEMSFNDSLRYATAIGLALRQPR